MDSMLHTMDSMLHTMDSMLHTMDSMLHTMDSIYQLSAPFSLDIKTMPQPWTLHYGVDKT